MRAHRVGVCPFFVAVDIGLLDVKIVNRVFEGSLYMNYIKKLAAGFLAAAIVSGVGGSDIGVSQGPMGISMMSVAQADALEHLNYRPFVVWPAKIAKENDKYAVTIMGEAVVGQQQMIDFILSRNPNPKLSCSLEALVAAYYDEAPAEGIRPDVALCQAIKETGFFAYGGDVDPKQNNYCGLGATGNKEPGYTFATAQEGVRAHIQHLEAYAANRDTARPLVDPRYEILVTRYPHYHGAAVYWSDLNGRWAVPGTYYGQDIIQLWYTAQSPDFMINTYANVWAEANATPNDAKGYMIAAAKMLKLGSFAEALGCYNRALDIDKNNIKARTFRGDIYRDWGRNQQALQEYDMALAIDPAYRDALLGKAQILVLQHKESQAMDIYQDVLSRDPKNAIALYNAANIQAKENNLEEAMDKLNQVLLLKQDCAEALYARGVVEEQMGDLEAARADYAKAQMVDPQMKVPEL